MVSRVSFCLAVERELGRAKRRELSIMKLQGVIDEPRARYAARYWLSSSKWILDMER